MNHYIRLLLTGLSAMAILAVAVGAASAGRLSSSSSTLRVAWASLEFANNVNTTVVRCPVTLEGSFHSRTIRKTARTLIGLITAGAIGTCAEGRGTILRETLPWHVTYESFAGTLPNITSVTILLVGAAFEIEAAGNTCRARTSTEENAAGIARLGAGGRVEGLRADETRRIRLSNGRGGVLCAFASGNFIGSGTVTQLGSATPVSITLI